MARLILDTGVLVGASRGRLNLHEALNFAPVLDYTHEVAGEHAALLAHVQRTGTPVAPTT